MNNKHDTHNILTIRHPVVGGPLCDYGAQPVVLTGIIKAHAFPGRPNYESIARGDEPERMWLIHLDKPICVETDMIDKSFAQVESEIVTPMDSISHFGLFVREKFFDKSTCEDIVAAMRSSESGPATLYGRTESSTIDNNIRRSLKCQLSPTIANVVKEKLFDCTSDVEKHFSVKVRECEEPQFLHYRVGDFFVAHQDGNTGLLRLDQENRRISVVIFLSPSDAHRGGELVFHDYREQRRFAFSTEKAGTLVAFASETTHEVTPVISGERFSIACWYR